MAAVFQTEGEGLRQRNKPITALSEEDARQKVLELNALEENNITEGRERKTFGRTPNGTVFTVPQTHDMVSQLLSPYEPKNLSDLLVISLLASLILLLWKLPSGWRQPVFACMFLLWRVAYNVGIGFLLHQQSQYKLLTRQASLLKIFNDPSTGDNPRPWLFRFLKREFERKIPKDYDMTKAPLEYNTWLLFRRFVDVILLCDFVSYCCFAIACAHSPEESWLLFCVRWSAGICLFMFNLWVKLDAHRVVKDYAWYWGDFFFLIDQDLTFDGVFEMAPHPMYSIGYAGFYGISLMTASYKVLYISVVAHAMQFAFLALVESPHIERTYSSPPPRLLNNDSVGTVGGPNASIDSGNGAADLKSTPNNLPPPTHNLLGWGNIDLHRSVDLTVFILYVLIVALTTLTPNTPLIQALFVVNAAIWRLWYSVGLGYILNRQSAKKKWTRHFLKYGEGVLEAWRQWKGIYHISMMMCYASFSAAAWKMYSLPSDWNTGLTLLRHILGIAAVALQLWVAFSIYDQLGEFGWFFGDFFFDQQPKLTYGGIYRFLNNPERVLGLAGVWGLALITLSRSIFGLALLSHLLSLAFIQFVERPHMQKLYGTSLRQDAGLVKTLRRTLPPPVRELQEGIDKVLGSGFDYVEEILDATKPKVASGVNHVLEDTMGLLHKYPGKLHRSRFDSGSVDIDTRNYSLSIDGTVRETQDSSDEEQAGKVRPLVLEYGAPIVVRWTAPPNHSKLDWVGLYRVSDNPVKEATHFSSAGRWIATNPGEFGTAVSEVGLVSSDVKSTRVNEATGQPEEVLTGEMQFMGDKLFWTQGTFEFRYHHNGKHTVMATSIPFEVRIPRWNAGGSSGTEEGKYDVEEDSDELDWFGLPAQSQALIRNSIEKALLPIIQNCFDRDPDIAPSTAQEPFGGLVGRDRKYATRAVYAIKEMFGIEFAAEVIKADGKIENLAWRIWEAKRVLAPYSMKGSRGVSTPVEGEIGA
ncbi:hypothetical protein DV738_g4247, partial [Chaetothyriales sp. CBS 135597]